LYGISNSDDKTVRVWDLNGRKLLWVFSGHTHWVSSLVPFVMLKKKAVAATSSFDKIIKIWSLRKGKCLQTLEGHTDYVYVVIITTFDSD
jgi:WD40 repeat protein